MNIIDFIQGFIIASTLIIAIGPQNLFVIQQGLKKSHIFIVCLICSVSDALLIVLGIFLSVYISNISEYILDIFKIIGSIWLILYGITKIKNSFRKKNIHLKDNFEKLSNIVLITLTFTFLNPHVYLDTIILIGSISLNFNSKISFGTGVILSSFVFFFSLGYFSKYISRFINNNKGWIIIDNFFGILMIFYGLLFAINI